MFVAMLVSAAAVAYVAWPLVQPGPAPVVIENDRLTDLIGRKDATLIAIKELEFDYNTGKLSAEDYARMDQRLRRQAIGYIQQIEKLAPESAQMDGRIEAEIAGLRKVGNTAPAMAVAAGAISTPHASKPAAEPMQTVAAIPATASSTVKFCTNCGSPLQPTHKFCANCGAAVPVESAAMS